MSDREQARREPVFVGPLDCFTCPVCATTYATVHPACPQCSERDRLLADREQAERQRDELRKKWQEAIDSKLERL